MTNPRLLAEIATLVRQIGRVPAEVAITADSRLVEDLSIGSLDLVALVVKIQDDYGVDVLDDDLPGLLKVGDVASYVDSNLGAAAA